MGKNMILPKNTVCYVSEIGHNNFFYPSKNKAIVKKSCQVQELSWVSGSSKKAVKILKENLIPLNKINETFVALKKNNNSYAIVWIENNI